MRKEVGGKERVLYEAKGASPANNLERVAEQDDVLILLQEPVHQG